MCIDKYRHDLDGHDGEPRGISYLFGVIVRVKVKVDQVTNNSLSKDYLHPDAKQINDVKYFNELTSSHLSLHIFASSRHVIQAQRMLPACSVV